MLENSTVSGGSELKVDGGVFKKDLTLSGTTSETVFVYNVSKSTYGTVDGTLLVEDATATLLVQTGVFNHVTNNDSGANKIALHGGLYKKISTADDYIGEIQRTDKTGLIPVNHFLVGLNEDTLTSERLYRTDDDEAAVTGNDDYMLIYSIFGPFSPYNIYTALENGTAYTMPGFIDLCAAEEDDCCDTKLTYTFRQGAAEGTPGKGGSFECVCMDPTNTSASPHTKSALGTLTIDKAFTLDLNGYDLTSSEDTCNPINIVNNGSLTVRDTNSTPDGRIWDINRNVIILSHNGKITVESGNIVSESGNNSAIFAAENNVEVSEVGPFPYTITINVTGGKVESKGASGISAYGSNSYAIVTISGDAEVKGYTAAVNFNCTGNMTVSGTPKLTGTNSDAVIFGTAGSNLTISGGTFKTGTGALIRALRVNSSNAIVNISGGTFGQTGTPDSLNGVRFESFDTVSLTGGTYESIQTKVGSTLADIIPEDATVRADNLGVDNAKAITGGTIDPTPEAGDDTAVRDLLLTAYTSPTTPAVIPASAYGDKTELKANSDGIALTSAQEVSVNYGEGDDAKTYTATVSATYDYHPMYTINAPGGYDPGSSGPVGGGTQPSGDGVPVIIDGETHNIGDLEVDGSETTVTIDQEALDKQLDSAKESVVVPVSSNTATLRAKFVVANVEEMAEKNMTLELRSGNTSFFMRATGVDTEALMAATGETDSTKVPFFVSITQSSTQPTVAGATALMPAVDFETYGEFGGKKVYVEKFNNYTRRTVDVTESIARQITTAVTFDDGVVRHVPTYVYQEGGKWFAKISSLTSSLYVLIHNEQGFADAEGKWFEDIVSEMASRKILEGRMPDVYDGETSITRAEFAAMVVRALGLPENGKSNFSDVLESAWYYGAVGTAYEYGIIEGMGDGSFAPQKYISRQDAMLIVQRAAKIAEYVSVKNEYGSFSDLDTASGYAKEAMLWNLENGFVVGDKGLVRPLDNISRAESATIVLRLLQRAELVDVRTEA